MLLEIKLYDNYGKFKNGKERVRVDEDFEFEIDTNIKDTLIYVANNGKETKKGLVKDNKFELARHFIKVGKLSIKIEQVKDNRVAKTFIVEDMLIAESDNGVYTIPEVEVLKDKINEYSALVESLKVQVEILTKLTAGLYNTEIKGV